jgi:hypothetical protein
LEFTVPLFNLKNLAHLIENPVKYITGDLAELKEKIE